jgi:cytochrome c553
MRILALLVGAVLAGTSLAAQVSEPGRQAFVSRCAGCHGTDGNGGELGPNIATRIPSRTDQDLATVIRQGLTLLACRHFPTWLNPR